MEGARLRWRTATTALLGFLSLAFLLPGTSGLECHSYSSIQTVSRDKINSEFSVSSNISTCSASQTACVEAHLKLWTGKMAMLVTHRGCINETLKDRAGYTASGNPHFAIHANVSYCQSDLCNVAPKDPNVFQMPEEDKAFKASSNQCYSGFVVDPDQDILDRVTCGKDYSQCYHGNGTVTAGNTSVDFLVKSCHQPSCNVPQWQSFGPIKLRLQGACCHGDFCNGKAGTVIYSTRFSEYGKNENGTRNTFSVAEEVTNKPANIWDVNTRTTTHRNPLYDYEETYDSYPGDSYSNYSLNPRTWNLGSPQLSLPFYLLLVPLGLAILGI